ncbi:MAG: rRNA maturation RNase YbeY, partial [Candidatus Electrothrix sp. AR3]|nr:rRNA maturation RNase YbeY [Candidatus Electrothrix sp. AR3]
MLINFINNYRKQTIPLHEELLRQRTFFLLEQVGRAESSLSIVLLDDTAIAEYNQQYRSKQGPTNVLSFPVAEYNIDSDAEITEKLAHDELGDILISVDTAQKEAQEKQISLHRWLSELIIHGLLHLLGYDHEQSEAQAAHMQNKERQLFRAIQSI